MSAVPSKRELFARFKLRDAVGSMLFRAVAPAQLEEQLDEETRSQLFVASDESIDAYGDVIVAAGWQLEAFKENPIALWAHDQRSPPIGTVDDVYIERKSKRLMARIKFDPPGDPRIDRLWDQVKRRVIRAVSVGFTVDSHEDIEPILDKSGDWTGGLRFLRARLLELSLVNVPANPNALAVLRSFPTQQPLHAAADQAAATYLSRSARPPVPAARRPSLEGPSMPTPTAVSTSEHIMQLEAQRAARERSLCELSALSETEGRAFTPEERTTFDEITDALERDAETLARLRKLETIKAAGAQRPVQTPRIEVVRADKGIRFARYVQAYMGGRCNFGQAAEIAKRQWPDDAEINGLLRAHAQGYSRAAVTAGTTTDAAWAGALVAQQNLSGEIIELVRKEAIIGQLPGLRRVPFNVRIQRETSPIGTVGWVGQGMSKPVGKGAFDFVTIPFAKVALIVVLTLELVRFSDPSAETTIRDQLVRAIADFLNSQFISSSAAPVANVSPGGINNGLPPGQIIAATGSTVDAIQADTMAALMKLYAGGQPRSPAWIMNTLNAMWLGSLQNVQGNPAFPGAAQGRLHGVPIVASSAVPTTEITLVDQDSILLASDDSVSVDSSGEASVQMDSAPATPPTPLVSFWQQNLIGIKAEQFAYWMRARDTAVVLLNTVGYLPAAALTTLEGRDQGALENRDTAQTPLQHASTPSPSRAKS